MLKKVLASVSILLLLSVSSAIAKGNKYTYIIQPLNSSNLPVKILGVSGDQNVEIKYVPGTLQFKLIDKSGVGALGKASIVIGFDNLPFHGSCVLNILSSGDGGVNWINSSTPCLGDIDTNHHMQLTGNNTYSFLMVRSNK